MEVELPSSGEHRACIGGISRKHIREHSESSGWGGASQPSCAKELAGGSPEAGVSVPIYIYIVLMPISRPFRNTFGDAASLMIFGHGQF